MTVAASNRRTNGLAQKGPSPRAGDWTDASANPRNLVNSLAKGLRVLESFTADRLEMTLSEIAVASGLDAGTAFRMLNTLEMSGYVVRVPESKRFRLSLKVTELGLHAIGQADLREVARPILRSLVGEVNEAASLGVLDGGDILYIERVRAGVTRLGVDIRIGTTIPALHSIIGHALLALLPPADLERALAAKTRTASIPPISTSRKAIDQSLRSVRKAGYILRDSPLGNGLQVLAVPVLDLDGYPVAAISVAAPTFRFDQESFRARALAPVRQAAHELGRAVQAGGSIVAAK
jgi:IclR family transcriptional regulator, pca regulon regulatory protein